LFDVGKRILSVFQDLLGHRLVEVSLIGMDYFWCFMVSWEP